MSKLQALQTVNVKYQLGDNADSKIITLIYAEKI